MDAPPDTYYTEERWQNWLDRLGEEELDPEEEATAKLLLNMQDDAALAVATVLTDYDTGALDEAAALDEIATIRESVLSEVTFEDEATALLVDGVQTSLVCVLAAAEAYVTDGPPDEGRVEAYLRAAADAEATEDLDAALGYCTQAGTLVIDGADLTLDVIEDLDYGVVVEWVNGLDSLQAALAEPEVIDDDAEADAESADENQAPDS